MPLTDTAIRNAKPTDKTQRLTDGGGMYLEIAVTGGKLWRLKYRFAGKEKRLALGIYPDTGLKEAREKRDAARKLLAAGIDPSAHRKAVKAAGEERAANSFEIIAREWFAKQSNTWVESHAARILSRLENNIFPWLGKMPIAEIKPKEILETLKRVVGRGANESAHRLLQICGQIFRYAIVTERAERNPCTDLRGALPTAKQTHRAAITDIKAIGGLLRAIDDYEGTIETRCALKLAPLLFVRPGELRQAEWAEFDLDAAMWTIPAAKMKMGESHIVPLSKQALEVIAEIQPLTGRGRFVFPSA